MTKRTMATIPVLALAGALILAGCGQQQTPAEPTPGTTTAPTIASTTSAGEFDELLPKNTIGNAAIVRSEGMLTPGEPIEASGTDLAEGGWIAQFACKTDGEVTAEVLVNDATMVGPQKVTCGQTMPEGLKLSGGGTITLRITGESDGIYVMQLTKDPSV